MSSPTKRHRILHAIPTCDPAGGGPMEGLRQLAAALKPLGVDVEVITNDTPGAPFLDKQPFPVHPLGPPKPGKFGFNPRMAGWIAQHGHEFDRIVVNGLWQYNGVAVWKTRKQHKRPYFVFCHGMMDSWFRKRYPLKHLKKQIFWWTSQGKVLRDAEKVLFTSEEERVQSHNGFWPYNLTEQVVMYGTAGLPEKFLAGGEPGDWGDQGDLGEEFSRMSPPSPLSPHSPPSPKSKSHLLYLGRIHVKKGCDLLIRAFAKAKDIDPNLDLVFAGPDQTNWRPELEAMAESLGVKDRIHWIGMVSGDQKWRTFLDAEAFVLPSHQENFGIAVAEALSAGLPVLISDKVNIWREIEADGAGLIAPDDQAGTDRLIERWAKLTPDERQAMKAKARPCFEKNFEIGQAARKLIEVYGLEIA